MKWKNHYLDAHAHFVTGAVGGYLPILCVSGVPPDTSPRGNAERLSKNRDGDINHIVVEQTGEIPGRIPDIQETRRNIGKDSRYTGDQEKYREGFPIYRKKPGKILVTRLRLLEMVIAAMRH